MIQPAQARRIATFVSAWLTAFLALGLPVVVHGQPDALPPADSLKTARPAGQPAFEDLFLQGPRPLPDEGQLRRELPTEQAKLNGWLDDAARVVALSDGAWQPFAIRAGQLLVSAEMARDLRLAIAAVRHDPAARRLALQEHVQLLRGVFDEIEALHRRDARGGEMLDLALAGCRLAQACADLADDMRRPAQRLANLQTHIAWADLLADAIAHHYETESTGASFRPGFQAAVEPYFARIEWAQLRHDCPAKLEQWSGLHDAADLYVRKVSALHQEAAVGGQEENLAYAERSRARARAGRARAAGDPGAQRQALERAVLWSNRLVKAYDAALDLGVCTPADLSLAQRGLADDRVALARFCRDRSTPQLARTELLIAATTLCARVRTFQANRSHGGSAWDLAYVRCVQALAELRIWSPCDEM